MRDVNKPDEPGNDRSDRVFREELAEIKKFQFDDKVAHVFDDMVLRSVPRYSEVQEASAAIAEKLCKKGGRILDLGCSTGTTLFGVAQVLTDESVELIGIDNSEPMLKQAQAKGDELQLGERVKFICGDLLSVDLPPADFVMMNYTLQFIPVGKRTQVLKKVAQALKPGGALLLTEKVRHFGARLEPLMTELYYDFKRDNRYSELEIAQKRDALEGVLVPLSVKENIDLLRQSSFAEVELYLKWITFATFIALK